MCAKDRLERSPLYFACVEGSKKVLRELARSGADVKATNLIGETLLHAVFRAPFMTKGHVSCVQELLLHQRCNSRARKALTTSPWRSSRPAQTRQL